MTKPDKFEVQEDSILVTKRGGQVAEDVYLDAAHRVKAGLVTKEQVAEELLLQELLADQEVE
jgi:hypothetical protein